LAALFDVALPEPAKDLLPQGEFIADEGPFWFAHKWGKLAWFGAEETLYAGEDGSAESHSAHMPIRLKHVEDDHGRDRPRRASLPSRSARAVSARILGRTLDAPHSMRDLKSM
jgi:hypothetical protein